MRRESHQRGEASMSRCCAPVLSSCTPAAHAADASPPAWGVHLPEGYLRAPPLLLICVKRKVVLFNKRQQMVVRAQTAYRLSARSASTVNAVLGAARAKCCREGLCGKAVGKRSAAARAVI